ncbi:relaxase/mobilization nuclease domain-containing protein [Undibacterium arcticum]
MLKKTIAVEIGNVTTLDNAAGEMRATASFNKLVTNPTLHYILSWPEREVPDTQAIFAAARSTLKALGMSDHQYIIAIHGNTDNIHAHIAANRVHPITYKAVRLEWLHKTLHKAAREIEIEHGWTHDNGLFKVIEINGKKTCR